MTPVANLPCSSSRPFRLLFFFTFKYSNCNRLCVEVVALVKEVCFPESSTFLGRLLNNLGALHLKLHVPISLFILGSFSL